MTKEYVFTEIYQDFAKFMNYLVSKIEETVGFTDTQKLEFLTEIITKRETYGTNASEFFNSFIVQKQNVMLSVSDDILGDMQTELNDQIAILQIRRDVLAS